MRQNLLHYSSLLTIMILTACTQQQEKKVDNEETVIFFNPNGFGGISQTSSLEIEARFSECGEWGGHKETITIIGDKDKRFYATYKIFPYNCDSLDFYYNTENIAPVYHKKIPLTEITQKSIANYIQRLIHSKITESFPGHAGNLFSVVNSDSTLYIRVYDRKIFDVKSFEQLVTELTK